MKRKLVIGSIVSLLFLFLALRGTNWSEFTAVLKKTRYPYLVLAIFFTMLGHYLRAYRWRFMLAPVKKISTGSLFSATAIGFMASNLLPARLGEVVRAYAIGKSESISKTAAFATIVYERIIDVFIILIFLWLTLFKVTGPHWLRKGGYVILLVNVVALIVLFLVERYRQQAGKIIEKVLAKLPFKIREWMAGSISRFFDGLKIISERKYIFPIVLTSLIVWYAILLGFYFCFSALEMGPSHIAAATLVVVVSFGTMIPSAPAFIGTMQYACIVGLALHGVNKSEALAYSILYHSTQFFPITLVGLFYLFRTHLGFDEIARTERG